MGSSFNREALIKPESVKSFRPEELIRVSWLKFIPMYSPAQNESMSLPQSLQANASCTPCRRERITSEYDPFFGNSHSTSVSRQYSFLEFILHDLSLDDQTGNRAKHVYP